MEKLLQNLTGDDKFKQKSEENLENFKLKLESFEKQPEIILAKSFKLQSSPDSILTVPSAIPSV